MDVTPRRRGGRRAGEQHLPIDWHEPYLLFLSVMILLLSVADAFLTITLIMGGAQEANPLLAFVLRDHPELFAVVKMGLTGTGVLVLVAVARARSVSHHARRLRPARAFLWRYVALIAYEWWLAAHILVTQARLNLMLVWLHYARLRARGLHNRLRQDPPAHAHEHSIQASVRYVAPAGSQRDLRRMAL